MNLQATSPLLCGLAPGAHILYVDDQETLVVLAKRTFEGLGYRYSGYSDPRAALRDLRATPEAFDLVLTDLNLGMMSGLDIAREVSKFRPALPVILISAYLTADTEAQAHAAGVRRVLAKAATFDDLIRELATDEEVVADEPTLIEHTPVAGRPLNVLVVDDDAAVRRFLCDVLDMDGHRTAQAENGSAAIRHLESWPADVVITDLCMPEKEGIEMIRELRRMETKARIIAISGIMGQPALAAAKILGADAVLPKPVGAAELLDTVATIAAA